MKKILKYFTLTLLLSIVSYFLLAYLFTFFPTKVNNTTPKDRNIYILYSPAHTDIIFNIQDLTTLNLGEFNTKKRGYLAFGWGDKGVYMNTPTWSELEVTTGFKALFLPTPAIMHVSYYPNILRYRDIKKISLTTAQLRHLETSILSDFNTTKEVFKGYQKHDFFYPANHSYTLINTCNTWTGDKLREANVSMSYWTPLSQNVTASLP